MTLVLDELPNDVTLLKRYIVERERQWRSEREAELERLQAEHQAAIEQAVREAVAAILRRYYGPRSEKFDPRQLLLFGQRIESAPLDTASVEAEAGEKLVTRRIKNRDRHGRQQLPARLERIEIEHDLADKACPACGSARCWMGAAHRAAQMLALIGELYAVEREAKDATDDQRLALRQERSAPLLARIKTWLDAEGQIVLPRSPLGQAITYAQNQWTALGVYTTQGFLSIDNNASERSLKRVAIGRKNWLFAGHDDAAESHARLWSLLASSERHAVDPQRYLTSVLGPDRPHAARRTRPVPARHVGPKTRPSRSPPESASRQEIRRR